MKKEVGTRDAWVYMTCGKIFTGRMDIMRSIEERPCRDQAIVLANYQRGATMGTLGESVWGNWMQQQKQLGRARK